MKNAYLLLLLCDALLLSACASVDNAAEGAKLEAAAKTYRQCLVNSTLINRPDVDLYCRSARIGVMQAVLADPRPYTDKGAFTVEYLKLIVEMAHDEIILTKK